MKRCAVLIAVLSLLLVNTTAAYAVGMGLYGSFGTGSADWDADGSAYSAYDLVNTDNQHKTFGLALDTRLSGDGLFNYHLGLGYDKFTANDFLLVPQPGGTIQPLQTDLRLKGFVMSHAFGFGGEVAPHARLWIGPELRFGWYEAKPVPTVDVDMFGIGIGPVIGLNINIGHRFSAVIKAGYQMVRYDADIEGSLNSTTSVSRNLDVREKMTYINMEFFVRSLGDR